MKITLDLLKELNACNEGINYFKQHYIQIEHDKLIQDLSKEDKKAIQAAKNYLLEKSEQNKIEAAETAVHAACATNAAAETVRSDIFIKIIKFGLELLNKRRIK